MEKWQKSSLSSSGVIVVSNSALFVSSRNAPPKERGEALRDEPKTAGMERGWKILVSLAVFRTFYGMSRV